MSQDGRKALHAYVSDHAHDQWHDFAAEQGVSVSAILETLAPKLTLDAEREAPIGDRIQGVVTQARGIDAQRRRRLR